ncbi:glycosyltransferase family 2 protein [Massilia sp. S19_KUP03_FR1]|uniref:glycosyltransferase family 2 protein n=1 Tax=Massilia sp. S19_KUP03_FR1 TaxID=3025503 RepID=UPI002FCD9229
MNSTLKTPLTAVILATYNGEKFLPEQLASLSNQSRKIDILILRDDGSNDNSVAIVQTWARKEGVILQELDGPRLGPARSFLYAVRHAIEADIYFFCDQDDFWEPGKIELAVKALGSDRDAMPALYASRLRVVDENLNAIRLSTLPSNLSFASAACESLLTGCTLAFNHSFRLLVAKGMPQHAIMHDWWCYLIATGCVNARLCFDSAPTLQYRQHGSNAIGAGPTGFAAMRMRVRTLFSAGSSIRSKQLSDFSEIYGALLRPESRYILAALLRAKCSVWRRVLLAFSIPISRQSTLLTLTTRFAIFTNRF